MYILVCITCVYQFFSLDYSSLFIVNKVGYQLEGAQENQTFFMLCEAVVKVKEILVSMIF